MSNHYCSSCGTSLMRTMRICPQCGNKSFSETPLAKPVSTLGQVIQQKPPSSNTFAPGSFQSQSIRQFEPAGHLSRFAASFLDGLILAVIGGILFALSTLIGSAGGGHKLAPAFFIVMWVALPYIYYTTLHSGPNQASWGKAAFGLILVTLQGERLTKWQAFIRVLLQFLLPVAGYVMIALVFGSAFSLANEDMQSVMVIAIAIGILAVMFGPFLVVYFNPQRQTLFDQICKTCVIKKPIP